jgi:outer membrane protein OmpA-like peptidoglycan-associated protein
MFSKHQAILIAATLPALAACASAPAPRELLDARHAYAVAANGKAADHNPTDLEAARQALLEAEQAFEAAPGADRTRDLAYLAAVKALTAELRGRTTASERARVAANEQFRFVAARKIDAKNAALASEVARTQSFGVALVAEQQRRSDAEKSREDTEKRLHEAMDRLASLAAVKEEQRGTIITISGSVLFATDKSDLLPTAADRLDDVADALTAQPERTVTIHGFTDSRGDPDYNRALSQRRAKAVYNYLVSRGVDSDQLSYVGRGSNDPVADNATAEGRANNRRVEIVIARPPAEPDVYRERHHED